MFQCTPGADISFLDNEENRFEWQKDILKIIYDEDGLKFKESHDRDIIWIYDPVGNSGKSKFVGVISFILR